ARCHQSQIERISQGGSQERNTGSPDEPVWIIADSDVQRPIWNRKNNGLGRKCIRIVLESGSESPRSFADSEDTPGRLRGNPEHGPLPVAEGSVHAGTSWV